jgi:hypothetical protein
MKIAGCSVQFGTRWCTPEGWLLNRSGWPEFGAEGFGVGVVQVVEDGQGLGPDLAGGGQVAVGMMGVAGEAECLRLVPEVA